MPKEVKPLSAIGTAAVQSVLSQQGKELHEKFWDGNCHAAALTNLAKQYFVEKAKHGASGKEGASGFYDELKGTDGGDWMYASNMKKRLAELKLIPATSTTGTTFKV